jgi:hypothetical protein
MTPIGSCDEVVNVIRNHECNKLLSNYFSMAMTVIAILPLFLAVATVYPRRKQSRKVEELQLGVSVIKL